MCRSVRRCISCLPSPVFRHFKQIHSPGVAKAVGDNYSLGGILSETARLVYTLSVRTYAPEGRRFLTYRKTVSAESKSLVLRGKQVPNLFADGDLPHSLGAFIPQQCATHSLAPKVFRLFIRLFCQAAWPFERSYRRFLVG